MEQEREVKINYDLLMEEEIKKLNGKRPKLLMHSCCGPCSTECINRLKDYFDITVIYYNPNIEPKSEYEKRKSEQIRFLNEVNIPLMDADYENELYRDKTKSLQNEPEGGARCSVCFLLRLEYTAKKAIENNYDYFTTTLTVSPHKNSQVINKIGERVGKEIGIKYLYADFKKKDGYKKSIEYAKEYNLYRQNYCGCLYSKEDVYEE